jgi:hypothetical protein
MAGMAATLAFTIPEAVTMLSPAVSEDQLRDIIRALRWQPAGRKRTGHAGRPSWSVLTYEWEQILRLHGALAPWLG